MKIDEEHHPADILTKGLQGRDFVYTRARVLELEGGVPPPPKCQPKDATGPNGLTQELAATQAGLAARRRHLRERAPWHGMSSWRSVLPLGRGA